MVFFYRISKSNYQYKPKYNYIYYTEIKREVLTAYNLQIYYYILLFYLFFLCKICIIAPRQHFFF